MGNRSGIFGLKTHSNKHKLKNGSHDPKKTRGLVGETIARSYSYHSNNRPENYNYQDSSSYGQHNGIRSKSSIQNQFVVSEVHHQQQYQPIDRDTNLKSNLSKPVIVFIMKYVIFLDFY